MIGRIAEAMWGVARVMLSPGYLIDKLLDRLDEVSGMLVPVRLEGLACNHVPAEALHDPFSE